MDKFTLIKELWLRLNSGKGNTPAFFQKIKSYSWYVLLAVLAVFGLEWLEVFKISDKLTTVLIAVATWALGTGGTAAATVESKDDAGIKK